MPVIPDLERLTHTWLLFCESGNEPSSSHLAYIPIALGHWAAARAETLPRLDRCRSRKSVQLPNGAPFLSCYFIPPGPGAPPGGCSYG